jgi:hypothetical protein
MSDQPETELSIWERSTFVRFFRWLFSWRIMRRVIIVLAWTVTIIALWYGEEDWRGRRAWNQYRQAAEARGEPLDYAAYIPKSVPDDQNFAATPIIKSFFQTNDTGILTNDLWSRAANNVTDTNAAKDRGHRHFLDLVAWQMASAALHSGQLKREQEFETDQTDLAARAAAAPAILEGMEPDAAAFAELRAAGTREFSRYPVKYDMENPWAILLPHLAKIKGVCQRLHLEACAQLAAGQNDQALADVNLTLALADSVKSEPFLISYLVRVACFQIALQPVWEGLAEQRWTDAQLQELQARFLSCDFLAGLKEPLNAERACGIAAVDMARKSGIENLGDDSSDGKSSESDKTVVSLIGRLMPSGWYDREKLNYCLLFDAQRKGDVDLGARIVSPSRVASNSDELMRQIYNGNRLKALLHHRAIASMLLPSLNRVSAKSAAAQTAANQAALACALERYRLAHGKFPDQLEALTPQFISHPPNDVITGQPYKYRRTDDGQFVLYSVGWNEKDDGGVPGKTLFDQTQGDWVWQYPAK